MRGPVLDGSVREGCTEMSFEQGLEASERMTAKMGWVTGPEWEWA